MIALTDVLTTPQIARVSEYIEEMEKAGINPLNPRFELGLETLLRTWEGQLKAKGTQPELLACSLAYIVAATNNDR